MLERIVAGALNHLLSGEDWARARLRAFAGSRLCFELAPVSLVFAIDTHGYLVAPATSGPADVHIRLPDDTPVRFFTDRESIFGAASLSGAADLAETLGFVFRHLRWDAEAELARIAGDIPARRIVHGARALLTAQCEGVRRLAENLVEYAADETGVLIRPQRLASMTDDVARLAADLARLEQRISRLG